MTAYQTVEKHFRRMSRLQHLSALGGWDQAVMMPMGGAESRGNALAELAVVVAETMRSPELGVAFPQARSELHQLNDWQQANLREAGALHARWTAVDPQLLEQITATALATEHEWRQLCPANKWVEFVPRLKQLVNLVREESRQRAKATGLPPYEALMGLYEPGLQVSTVERVFSELRQTLPNLTQEALELQKRRQVVELGRTVPVARQRPLMKHFMDWIGFDFTHGRLDEAPHPFCGGVPRDVRLTTRYSEEDFFDGLMGVLHETGHACYEQGLPATWLEQPVGAPRGMAIHESQSLFFEMQIGRSREFFEFATPLLREHLAEPGDPDGFWTAKNLYWMGSRVQPGFIRVSADEVTYPAHIILRFELERALIEGQIEVEDLAPLWDEKMKTYLGLSTLGNDTNGCMQDVHWPSGAFGYFPSYTLGALIAAQLLQAVSKEIPDLKTQVAGGNLAAVRAWLEKNIWARGSQLSTEELLVAATGQPLRVEPFLTHLKQRYLRD